MDLKKIELALVTNVIEKDDFRGIKWKKISVFFFVLSWSRFK